jgi:uncharacterized protein
MLVGAAAYVAAFPTLQPLIKGLGDWGKITLPEVTQTSPWIWVGGLVLVGLTAFVCERLTGHGTKEKNKRLVGPETIRT